MTQEIPGKTKRYLGNENYRRLYWRDPRVHIPQKTNRLEVRGPLVLYPTLKPAAFAPSLDRPCPFPFSFSLLRLLCSKKWNPRQIRVNPDLAGTAFLPHLTKGNGLRFRVDGWIPSPKPSSGSPPSLFEQAFVPSSVFLFPLDAGRARRAREEEQREVLFSVQHRKAPSSFCHLCRTKRILFCQKSLLIMRLFLLLQKRNR